MEIHTKHTHMNQEFNNLEHNKIPQPANAENSHESPEIDEIQAMQGEEVKELVEGAAETTNCKDRMKREYYTPENVLHDLEAFGFAMNLPLYMSRLHIMLLLHFLNIFSPLTSGSPLLQVIRTDAIFHLLNCVGCSFPAAFVKASRSCKTFSGL